MDDSEPPILTLEPEDEKECFKSNNQESILEDMVAAAAIARKRKTQENDRHQRLTSKKFGQGLKKGFFQTAKSKDAKSREIEGKYKAKKCDLKIVNLDQKHSKESQNKSSLVFSEVQQAMKSNSALRSNEWMNEAFFEKLKKNPRLLLAFQNPRFNAAMTEMQQNPKAALLKYKNDEAVSTMLKEYLEFMSDHFEELGKQEKNDKNEDSNNMTYKLDNTLATAHNTPDASRTENGKIIDLDHKRREAIEQMQRSPEEEQQVQAIMKNPELLKILSDPSFMNNLHECQQDPQILHRLNNDPVFHKKLQLMIDAKLIKFEV